MSLRLVLPAVFAVVAVLFLTVNMIGVGHGESTFDFVLYCAYPAAFLTDLLESLIGGPDLLWLMAGLAGGIIQYYLVGYFIDKFLKSRE